ncbi:hypothetical protein B0H13DRAFT_1895009 [Mycena leptocephala]|nr:hypothetical protein B0H13DRAFT_1895009 [Mycena leptocephala]
MSAFSAAPSNHVVELSPSVYGGMVQIQFNFPFTTRDEARRSRVRRCIEKHGLSKPPQPLHAVAPNLLGSRNHRNQNVTMLHPAYHNTEPRSSRLQFNSIFRSPRGMRHGEVECGVAIPKLPELKESSEPERHNVKVWK